MVHCMCVQITCLINECMFLKTASSHAYFYIPPSTGQAMRRPVLQSTLSTHFWPSTIRVASDGNGTGFFGEECVAGTSRQFPSVGTKSSVDGCLNDASVKQCAALSIYKPKHLIWLACAEISQILMDITENNGWQWTRHTVNSSHVTSSLFYFKCHVTSSPLISGVVWRVRIIHYKWTRHIVVATNVVIM